MTYSHSQLIPIVYIYIHTYAYIYIINQYIYIMLISSATPSGPPPGYPDFVGSFSQRAVERALAKGGIKTCLCT